MIQRKQSLFLFVSLLLLISLYFISLGSLSGEVGLFDIRFYGLVDVADVENPQTLIVLWPLTVLLVVSTLLNLLDIFLFSNRPLQMRVCGINITIVVGVAIMILAVNILCASRLELDWHFSTAMIIPLFSAVLHYFAYRRIGIDEAIVRSLDRLR
ncbi:MAG: DUF4293 family protein [Bacteroidales bacterium]|jgi:uncharacterized membrane protein YwzB|nr:DUF4293 family protein [Bacteroidales bacterium]